MLIKFALVLCVGFYQYINNQNFVFCFCFVLFFLFCFLLSVLFSAVFGFGFLFLVCFFFLVQFFVFGIGEVKGFLFEQFDKNEYAYLYKVSNKDEDTEKVKCWYEVFERRHSKELDTVLDGQPIHFEEKENYPRSNSFGVWAWTFNNLDKAKEKFDLITERLKEKEKNKLLLTNNTCK